MGQFFSIDFMDRINCLSNALLNNYFLHIFRNDVNHEDFELKFDYSFLAPPVDHPVFDEKDEEVLFYFDLKLDYIFNHCFMFLSYFRKSV